MTTSAQKRVSLVVAKLIPPLIIAAIIYACFAVTKPLCLDYLIYPLPSYDRQPRVGAGVAILVLYYLLLIPLVTTYIRLLYNVMFNPGYLPLSAERLQEIAAVQASKPSWKRFIWPRGSANAQSEKVEMSSDLERGSNGLSAGSDSQAESFSSDDFYKKKVFVCQEDGRPAYCSKCCNFKTDRAHHCGEVDRCVRKMDHFCPWVGGVVSETSFKFFIQFVAYTAIYCIFAMIVSAYFTAELRRETGSVNPHWCACIGLSGFFGFFTTTMTFSSLQMASSNITTIENLNRRSRVWNLAVRVPEHLLERLWVANSPWAPTFRMVSYPPNTSTAPPQPQTVDGSNPERYVFAILSTQPGENPFDLGRWKNLQQVMGYTVLDWLLPLKPSPCADHSIEESAFALGPVVTRLKEEAGLLSPP